MFTEKPLVLEPWTSHPSATGQGAVGFGAEGRPEFIMNTSGHEDRTSAEGQTPNTDYTAGADTTGTLALDWRYGGCLHVRLTGNLTITVQNVPDGASGTVLVEQDGTGSRTLTIANNFSATNRVIGSVTSINPTANKYSTLTYKRFGSELVLVYGRQN